MQAETLLNLGCSGCRRRIGDVHAKGGFYSPRFTGFFCRECAVEQMPDHVQKCEAFWARPAASAERAETESAVYALAAQFDPVVEPPAAGSKDAACHRSNVEALAASIGLTDAGPTAGSAGASAIVNGLSTLFDPSGVVAPVEREGGPPPSLPEPEPSDGRPLSSAVALAALF